MQVQYLHRRTKDRWNGGCLQRIVDAAARYPAHFGDDILPRRMIDRVSRPEFARNGEPLIMNVHHDDRIAARDPCRHQSG
jgi:hypothetical protein